MRAARSLFAAVGFLTRVPIRGGGTIGSGAAFFPAVGAGFHPTPVGALVAFLSAAAIAVGADALLIPVAAGVAVLVGFWSLRRLGGFTGDTLGAATELAETAVLVAAAALA